MAPLRGKQKNRNRMRRCHGNGKTRSHRLPHLPALQGFPLQYNPFTLSASFFSNFYAHNRRRSLSCPHRKALFRRSCSPSQLLPVATCQRATFQLPAVHLTCLLVQSSRAACSASTASSASRFTRASIEAKVSPSRCTKPDAPIAALLAAVPAADAADSLVKQGLHGRFQCCTTYQLAGATR